MTKLTKKEQYELERTNSVFKIKRRISEEGEEHYFIEASTGGLYQFADKLYEIADDLLQGSDVIKSKLSKEDQLGGDITLDYIEVVREDINSNGLDKKTRFKEFSTRIGCIILLLFFALSGLICAATLIKWMFS